MPKFARSALAHALARVCTALTLALPLCVSADEIPIGNSVAAVWKVQVVELNFRSFEVTYSCASLQSKIAAILRPIVAHQATKVGIRCSGMGMGTFAKATIVLTAPVEATADNLRAMTTFDAREQLIARVRSLDLPAEEDIPRFIASWRTVVMSRGRGLRLDASDCDLVRGIRDQVLPHLAVKVTRSRSTCGMSVPLLEVEALLPVQSAGLKVE